MIFLYYLVLNFYKWKFLFFKWKMFFKVKRHIFTFYCLVQEKGRHRDTWKRVLFLNFIELRKCTNIEVLKLFICSYCLSPFYLRKRQFSTFQLLVRIHSFKYRSMFALLSGTARRGCMWGALMVKDLLSIAGETRRILGNILCMQKTLFTRSGEGLCCPLLLAN